MLFSQRKGLNPISKVIQIEEIDDELRISMWNAVMLFYFNYSRLKEYSDLKGFGQLYFNCTKLWCDYYKFPLDSLPLIWGKALKDIKSNYFNCSWYEVYDFIEFVAKIFQISSSDKNDFIKYCNSIFERESSGYRFIGEEIVQITDEEELAEIEEVLVLTDKFSPVSKHIKNALQKLSNRKERDYRNSIKESISAVESMCNLITGEKATLTDALKKLEKHINIHPALKNGFKKIYGYTSDEDGIRHSMLEEPKIEFEDAKYMLISCSAFINYLKSKVNKINTSNNKNKDEN